MEVADEAGGQASLLGGGGRRVSRCTELGSRAAGLCSDSGGRAQQARRHGGAASGRQAGVAVEGI